MFAVFVGSEFKITLTTHSSTFERKLKSQLITMSFDTEKPREEYSNKILLFVMSHVQRFIVPL